MDSTVEEGKDDDSKSDEDSDKESVIMDFQFAMAEIGMYDDRSILIDKGSTFSVMKNLEIVVNIR